MKCNIDEGLQNYYKLIGNRVKEARKKANIAINVLADWTDVTPRHIQFLEDGRPGYQRSDFLVKVARVLGVDIETIC